MPNPEHMPLLIDDENAWNSKVAAVWRNRLRLPLDTIDLSGADLRRRGLRNRIFWGVNLSGANLADADLKDSDFRGAILSDAVLYGADLKNSRFESTDLTQADLENANLTRARLYHANLTRARLNGAGLGWAVINGGVLQDTGFEKAVTNETLWARVDLRGALHLTTIRHHGPSAVSLDTILLSRGQIPEEFLRGCGVPDTAIAYIRSIGQSSRPIDWYSCFLSHSSIDREFCERLHNDLQAAGVRCWFGPEDLKIGDRFRDEIESAIRLHDKLLLVLSETSVDSPWVQTEVESALERERRERKQVLFPVRLDDAVMETSAAWAADIRRQRHIGDFSGWKNHDQYKRAFDRFLRDLRATRV